MLSVINLLVKFPQGECKNAARLIHFSKTVLAVFDSARRGSFVKLVAHNCLFKSQTPSNAFRFNADICNNILLLLKSISPSFHPIAAKMAEKPGSSRKSWLSVVSDSLCFTENSRVWTLRATIFQKWYSATTRFVNTLLAEIGRKGVGLLLSQYNVPTSWSPVGQSCISNVTLSAE